MMNASTRKLDCHPLSESQQQRAGNAGSGSSKWLNVSTRREMEHTRYTISPLFFLARGLRASPDRHNAKSRRTSI